MIDVIHSSSSPDHCISTDKPESFEKLGQGYGFILYQTKLKNLNVDGKKLSIIGIHDRGYISIGKVSNFYDGYRKDSLGKIIDIFKRLQLVYFTETWILS